MVIVENNMNLCVCAREREFVCLPLCLSHDNLFFEDFVDLRALIQLTNIKS